MRTRYKVANTIWAVFLALVASMSAYGNTEPKLQTLSAYTRIQIPVSNASNFRVVNGNGEARITIDRIRSTSLHSLIGKTDRRIADIKVTPQGLDKLELFLRFQEPDTQSFAYIQGNSLVVDLWKQEKSAAVATPKAAQPAISTAPKKQVVAAKPKKSPKRRPAQFEEEIYSKTQIHPLQKDKNLFSRFTLPMPELRIESKNWSFPAKFDIENKWKFSEADRKTADGRGFFLARKLFEEGKYGLTVKTAEITLRDNPQTNLAPELNLLQAFAYKKLGESTKNEALQQRADQMLTELAAQRVDGRPPAYHKLVRAYFGQKAYAKQNWFEAIEHMEYVMEASQKADPELPYVQLMLAEAYAKVGQPRRAERMYRYLTERYHGQFAAKEAAYRTVDLLATERNYQRVVEEGAASLEKYSDYEKARAEALFNIGEAYFWLGNYSQAEKHFKRFIDVASAQTNAALAWVRLGEIAEISRDSLAEARGAYLKAKNGYPFSHGDMVAGVRLARIDVNSEKDIDFQVKNLQQLLQEKSIDADMRRMTELVYVDYLLVSGKTEQAISIARGGMSEVEGVAYESYKSAFIKSLYAKLRSLNKDGKFAEAIALHDKEKKWLEAYGPDMYRTAAESYRGLGLYATSNELMERYAREKSMGSGRMLASSEAGRDLLLAKAKNSFARGAYADALAQLPDEEEAEITYMRAISEQRLGRKKEAQNWALKALNQLHQGEDFLHDDKIEELAEILIDRDISERDFVRMEKNVTQAIALRKTDSERLNLAAADSLWYQKKNKEAAAAYREWITKYPKSERLDRARYNLAMSLIGSSKREEAVKVLTELRDTSKSVWADSAKQELELLDWESKYSSILKTLPPTGLGISN
jgi:tetratricopeptide (TPR) repeat protein